MPIWEPRRLDPETCYEMRSGLLRVWLRHTFQDWYVAWKLDEPGTQREALRTGVRQVGTQPKDLDPGAWKRWVFETGTQVARFVPMAPDRSLVVQPDLPTGLPPGQRAMTFVTIPLWVGVAVGEGSGQMLCEMPTTMLSRTWYGDFSSGELCYSLRSRATRHPPPIEHAADSAVCPLQLVNETTTSLEFVHLLIQAEHLALYRVPGRIWTNSVDVVFQGQESRTTLGGAPTIDGMPTLLQPPRRVGDRSLVRKSFEFLKGLAGQSS